MIHIIIFVITLLIAVCSTLEFIAVINQPNRLLSMVMVKQHNPLINLGFAIILDFVWLFVIFMTNFGFLPFLVLVVAYLVQNISATLVIYYYRYTNQLLFKSYVLVQLVGILFELSGIICMIPVLKQYI